MNEIIIEHYKKIAKFLTACLGQDYEVIIQLVVGKELEEINFKQGSSSKQLKKSTFEPQSLDKENLKLDSIIKKQGLLKNYNGDSSILTIKNGDELLGWLWVNYNGDRASKTIEKIHAELKSLFNVVEYDKVEEKHNEYFVDDIASVIKNIIEPIIREQNYPITRLSFDEKMLLIEELKKQGVFLVKGAVSEAAIQLHSSEASIYRYLKNTKRT